VINTRVASKEITIFTALEALDNISITVRAIGGMGEFSSDLFIVVSKRNADNSSEDKKGKGESVHRDE
jgi:hypothetical protein